MAHAPGGGRPYAPHGSRKPTCPICGCIPASHHAIEIEQPEGRTDKRGQFVLPVSPPKQNADALFEQAQAAEETGESRAPLPPLDEIRSHRCGATVQSRKYAPG